MYFVYSIQSQINPESFYVGMTTDVERRLEEHNAGKSVHTNKFKPWKLIAYVVFKDKAKVEKFEAYLFRAPDAYFPFSNFTIFPKNLHFDPLHHPIHADTQAEGTHLLKPLILPKLWRITSASSDSFKKN
jgi:putative endonuclease